MLNEVKENITRNLLIRKPVQRKVQTTPFAQMKSIGVIYKHLEDQDQLKLINKFIKYLSEFKIEVHVLVYVDKKELPVDLTSKLRLDYISHKELNWKAFPQTTSAENFINSEFDLLLDFSTTSSFPIEVIMRSSKSKLKMGLEELKYSDAFDINLSLGNDVKLRYLLQQMDHYIQLLK